MKIIKTPFEELKQDIEDGIKGLNEGIPIGLTKLNKHASFRQRIFTLLFSSSGAGKSSLDDTMMLNACDYMIENNIKDKSIEFILFSMERSKKLRIAKWIVRKIFIEHHIEIQVPKLMGWWDTKLSKDEHDLVLKYEDYINELLESYINIYEGARTPENITEILDNYFEENGKYEDISKDKQIYIPNKPNKIVVPNIDHGNLTKRGKHKSKKEAIDTLVGSLQNFRDLEGASPFWVAQINRNFIGQVGLKDEMAEPSTDALKESGDVEDAADLILSLFDPLKFRQGSKTGYAPPDFVDKKNGASYFRSIQTLKSTYGESGGRIPLAFNGFAGDFRELPNRNDMSDDDYENLVQFVLDKSYFKK
jgi:hypothetical protein